MLEDGTPGHNLYGTHPVYLFKEKAGFFDMLLLRTTNALEFVVDRDSNHQRILTFKITGGTLDFRFFIGDTNPENVTKLYHTYLGG